MYEGPPPPVHFCSAGCQPTNYDFVTLLDDMLWHSFKVGSFDDYHIRRDDKPEQRLIGWTASESLPPDPEILAEQRRIDQAIRDTNAHEFDQMAMMAAAIGHGNYPLELPRRQDNRFWNIPITKLITRADQTEMDQRPDLYVDILERGQLLMTLAGRQEIAERILHRAKTATSRLELFPHWAARLPARG